MRRANLRSEKPPCRHRRLADAAFDSDLTGAARRVAIAGLLSASTSATSRTLALFASTSSSDGPNASQR